MTLGGPDECPDCRMTEAFLLILSLLSFSSFVIYLLMGVTVIRKGYRSRVKRLIFCVCLLFAVWAFSYSFIYPQGPLSSQWFWYRLSAFGWCLFPAVSLNLFFELAHVDLILKRKWIQFAAYLPAAVFLYQVLTDRLFTVGFEYGKWGTVEVQDTASFWFWAYLVYSGGYMLVSLWSALIWGIRSRNPNEKKQFAAILIFVSLSVILGFLFNMILPWLSGGKAGFPAVAPIFGLFWLSGFALAISRYQLIELTPQIAADEIISNIIDMVLLLNFDGSIRKTNRAAQILLGYSEENFKQMRFWELFVKSENARYRLSDIQKSQASLIQWEDQLKPRKGRPVPMNCIMSCVKDHLGTSIGVIFVGQDLSLVKRLEKEVGRSEIAEKKLQKAKETLEEKVAERTRELEMFATTDPLTGIYNRRIGLLLLEEEIHKAKRTKNVLTVCFVDINGLKEVNDGYGHKEGDDLILSVVNILKENLRESDILCRMGGDEFLIIMLECNLNQSLEVWEGVQKSIDDKNNRKLKSYLVSVSRGFAEYNPIYPMTLDELITTADYQMYQNKKRFKKVMDGE